MIIGKFAYDTHTDTYTGEIRTLTVTRSGITLRPQTRGNDREPDYRIIGSCGDGEVEFGAAWERQSDKGQTYLSVLLDDPVLGGALSAAIFREKDGTSANLVWSRPRSAPPAETLSTPARRTARAARPPAQG